MNHNSSKMYLEYYAKELLENLASERYSNLKSNDAPDLLMGTDYGIEVTWAITEVQAKANMVLRYCKGLKLDEIPKRDLHFIENNNISFLYNSGRVCGYRFNKNCMEIEDLKSIYEKKKQKCDRYDMRILDLFIYPPLAQLDCFLGRDFIELFCKFVNSDFENLFHSIIVFEEPSLYICDYSNGNYRIDVRRGTKEMIMECKKSADQYSGWSLNYENNV